MLVELSTSVAPFKVNREKYCQVRTLSYPPGKKEGEYSGGSEARRGYGICVDCGCLFVCLLFVCLFVHPLFYFLERKV